MTGRRLTHVPLGRGMYDIVADGHERIAHVVLTSGTARSSSAIPVIAAALARHQGDEYTDPAAPSDPWARLGWRDRAQYVEFSAEVRKHVDGWSGHPRETAYRDHLHTEKERAGIPDPASVYTFEQLATIERIVVRTPAIVDQDLAAEGTAA